MEIPDNFISDICTKLREVLHTLESYSDSEPKGELESLIESTSCPHLRSLLIVRQMQVKNSNHRPSDTLRTEQSGI